MDFGLFSLTLDTIGLVSSRDDSVCYRVWSITFSVRYSAGRRWLRLSKRGKVSVWELGLSPVRCRIVSPSPFGIYLRGLDFLSLAVGCFLGCSSTGSLPLTFRVQRGDFTKQVPIGVPRYNR